jgi:hypothetical protein
VLATVKTKKDEMKKSGTIDKTGIEPASQWICNIEGNEI